MAGFMLHEGRVNLRVQYFGLVRQRIPFSEEFFEMPVGLTLRQLFGLMKERHGDGFCDELLAPRGEPLPNVVLTLDGRRVTDGVGMDREILSSAVVRVLEMPPFTGGG